MKNLQRIHRFAHAHKLDGLTGYLFDRQGGAATCIAFHLGQHHAGDGQLGIKGVGHGDRVLAGHGVGDKEHFSKLHCLADSL